jgi:hypothetical protein
MDVVEGATVVACPAVILVGGVHAACEGDAAVYDEIFPMVAEKRRTGERRSAVERDDPTASA